MWIIFHPFWYIIYNVTFLDSYLYLPSYLLILNCCASILSLYISKCNEIALECVQDLYCWQWMRALSNDFQRNIFFAQCCVRFWHSFNNSIKHLHSQYPILHQSLSSYYQSNKGWRIVKMGKIIWRTSYWSRSITFRFPKISTFYSLKIWNFDTSSNKFIKKTEFLICVI
jgi:hypothetical protein